MRSQFWCDAFLLKPAGAAVAPAQCPLRGRSWSAAIAVFLPLASGRRAHPIQNLGQRRCQTLPRSPTRRPILPLDRRRTQAPAATARSPGRISRKRKPAARARKTWRPCRTLRRRNRSHDRMHEFVQHVGANETPQHSEGVLGGFAEQPVIRLGRRLSAYAGFHERRATRNNHGRAPERRGG